MDSDGFSADDTEVVSPGKFKCGDSGRRQFQDTARVAEKDLPPNLLRRAKLLQETELRHRQATRARASRAVTVGAIHQLVLVPCEKFFRELGIARERAVARTGGKIAVEIRIIRQPAIGQAAGSDRAG